MKMMIKPYAMENYGHDDFIQIKSFIIKEIKKSV